MDEKREFDVSPFLEDESDNDRVLDQAGESHVAATHPHPVAEAEQVLQQDRLPARLVMLIQLSVANVHLDRGRQIASVGFLKPVELAVDHLGAIGDLFKYRSEDGLQFSFANADLGGKRQTFFRQKDLRLSFCFWTVPWWGRSLLILLQVAIFPQMQGKPPPISASSSIIPLTGHLPTV